MIQVIAAQPIPSRCVFVCAALPLSFRNSSSLHSNRAINLPKPTKLLIDNEQDAPSRVEKVHGQARQHQNQWRPQCQRNSPRFRSVHEYRQFWVKFSSKIMFYSFLLGRSRMMNHVRHFSIIRRVFASFFTILNYTPIFSIFR